ncbi:DUF397 domain-containing protein [Streptomyces phaeolivaceus]|uniref:DUF397 domain-containing protein n=1 Tax=Streptomyces phaeolivaceus TaxID=2653200 RepID=A0A5P8K3J8_9ACTN|nr:DUF397 domain-containing protein [Streptomyces phaeolivaceus]QFQ97624.1 DUF397 domain-containing protein [Streptomyces phaeolivaceus]
MTQLGWQKSSFSSGGEGNCIELAAATAYHIHLRESDRPDQITTATPRALAHLLRTVKGGSLGR